MVSSSRYSVFFSDKGYGVIGTEAVDINRILVVSLALVVAGVHLRGRIYLHLAFDFAFVFLPFVHLEERVCVEFNTIFEPGDGRSWGTLSYADEDDLSTQDVLGFEV